MHPIEINQLLSDMYCITQSLLRSSQTVTQLKKTTKIPEYSVRLALEALRHHGHIYPSYNQSKVWRHKGRKEYMQYIYDTKELRRAA